MSEERHVLAGGRKSPIWDIYAKEGAPATTYPAFQDSKTSLLLNMNSSKYNTQSSPALITRQLSLELSQNSAEGSVKN